MGIPALDRGLIVLESLVSSSQGLRFSELKQVLSGITDTSLNRLLNSLLESGHIVKAVSGRYVLSDRVTGWIRILSSRESLSNQVERALMNLTGNTKESSGFCRLEDGRILVTASLSSPDSISILPPGGIIEFEEDHAAALAVLSELDTSERKVCLNSEYSRIDSEKLYESSLDRFNRGGVIADKSFRRPGISRIAVPLRADGKVSALFLCMPTEAVEEKLAVVANLLKFWKNRLEMI